MTLVLASANAALVSLVDPLIGDVILPDQEVGSVIGGLETAESQTDHPEAGESSRSVVETTKIGLARFLESSYETLKARMDIDEKEVLYFVPLLLVLVFTIRSVAAFLSGYSFQRVGLGVTTDVRNDLFERILGQSNRFFSRHSTGEIVSRVVNDVGQIQAAVSEKIRDLFQQSITLIFFVVLLFSTHRPLALMSLVLLPLFIFPFVRFGRGMRATSRRSQERMADLAEVVGEGVRGHRVVKAFGMEEFENERFRKATGRHLRVNLWAQFLASLSSPVIESIAMLGGAGLIVYAGTQIRAGLMTAEQFGQILTNLVFLYDPIRKLNRANLALQQSFAAGIRIIDVMEEPNDIKEAPDPVSLTDLGSGITIEGVSFGYGDQGVLHDIDLDVKPGEVVALVGPSGAGKSTLVNLLPRFFDPDEGRIAVGGVDIRQARIGDLRHLIALVTQETVLFDDTVRNNIAYGRADLDLDQVRKAAVAANADDFIQRLPDGYDSLIGEEGQSLSGGQRQRLAIARALLKDAPILILDEATSQLDSESEAKVQEALKNLMRGRTTLVIAHRLSTVTTADRIIVLDDGRIVETGTHEELLTAQGLYKELYELQFES